MKSQYRLDAFHVWVSLLYCYSIGDVTFAKTTRCDDYVVLRDSIDPSSQRPFPDLCDVRFDGPKPVLGKL